MKKSYFILLLLSTTFSIRVSAQSPILTAVNSNPVIGDNFTGQSINYTSPGSGGASQVWDFSTATSAGTQTFSFIDPSTTANAASFPTATVTTYNPANTVLNYLSTSASALAAEGFFYGAPTNMIVSYSNPQTVLSYPFSFGSNFTDTYSGTYTSGTSTIIRNGLNTVNADGYGTLIMPYGTLNNVLRVTVLDQYTDTTSFGAPYSEFTFETYNWYLPGVHYQVLSLTSLYMNGDPTPVAQFGTYLDQSSVGIPENDLLSAAVTIYPNPANEFIHIRSTEKIKNMDCFNYAGQAVDVKVENSSVDISSLSKGLYFIRITSENGKTLTQKFIKE